MAVFYADSESDLRYSCAYTAEQSFFLKAQKLYQFGNHENSRFLSIWLCLCFALSHTVALKQI